MNSRLPGALPDLHPLGPDSWTEPYWAAAREHRLVIAQCDNCGTYRSPPSPFCGNCNSQAVTYPTMSGEATIYTFTIVRHPVIPELEGQTPYVIAVVELADAPSVRLMTNIVTSDPDALEIGQTVHVAWDDLDGETTIPRFVP
jgi:uncharacterized OB-fold protein